MIVKHDAEKRDTCWKKKPGRNAELTPQLDESVSSTRVTISNIEPRISTDGGMDGKIEGRLMGRLTGRNSS